MIAEFEKDYWQRKEKTINRANNYKYDYGNHFLFLPQDQLLTPELFDDRYCWRIHLSKQAIASCQKFNFKFHKSSASFRQSCELSRGKITSLTKIILV